MITLLNLFHEIILSFYSEEEMLSKIAADKNYIDACLVI